eukprot:6467527-Pyramimonas_sp.AAC.1
MWPRTRMQHATDFALQCVLAPGPVGPKYAERNTHTGNYRPRCPQRPSGRRKPLAYKAMDAHTHTRSKIKGSKGTSGRSPK